MLGFRVTAKMPGDLNILNCQQKCRVKGLRFRVQVHIVMHVFSTKRSRDERLGQRSIPFDP